MDVITKTRVFRHFKIFFKKTFIFFVLVLGIWAVAKYFEIPEPYLTWVKRSAILLALFQTARWGNDLIRALLRSEHFFPPATSRAAKSLVNFFAKLLLYSILFVITLDVLGFNITALVAGLGVGGVAVALAVQNILGDVFSSLTIIFGRPFEVGDFITVGDALGTVESVGLKTTRLRSLSGEQIIFSNSDLLKTRIHNYKQMQERRVVFSLRLVLETPIEKIKRAKSIVTEETKRLNKVAFDRCHLARVGEYFLDLETVYMFKDPDYNRYMDTQETLLLNIVERFRDEQIELAVPARSIIDEKNLEQLRSREVRDLKFRPQGQNPTGF